MYLPIDFLIRVVLPEWDIQELAFLILVNEKQCFGCYNDNAKDFAMLQPAVYFVPLPSWRIYLLFGLDRTNKCF